MITMLRVRVPLLILAVVTLAIFLLIEWGGDRAVAALEFQRRAINQGEIWRLLTGNFTHFGEYHTWMNSAGLAALVGILFWYLPAGWLATGIVFVPIAVGMSLYWFADVDIYRGFSGANYGLLAMGLLLALPQQYKLYTLAYCVLLGKIVYEQLPGYDVDYLQAEIGVSVAIEAHLAGFCSGTVIGVLGLLRQRRTRRASDQQ